MYRNFFEKQTIKQFAKYVLPMYLILVVLGIIAYFTSSTVDTSGMFGGLAMLGHYVIWLGIILIVTVVLSIVLTIRNIKDNYNDNSESDYKVVISVVLKTLLIYMIVTRLINGIISLIINDFSINFAVEIIIELILVPIIIPAAKYFNKDNYVSKKTIRNVYLLCVGITIVFYLFSRVFTIIFYYTMFSFADLYTFFVFIIPTLIIGLQNNATSSKKIDKKKEILTIGALLLVLLMIILGINSIDKVEKTYTSKSDYTKDLYCMVPLKTSDNRIYYYASDSSICYKNTIDNWEDVTITLYNVNKNIKINAIVRNFTSDKELKTAEGIYTFPNDKLYYYSAADSKFYELDKNNKPKKIIGTNTYIVGYHNNDIYYVDYGTDEVKTLDLKTYKSNTLKMDRVPKRIIASYKNILVYQDTQSVDQYYKYDSKTKKSERLDFSFGESTYVNDEVIYTTQREYIGFYNMETNEIRRIKVTRENGVRAFDDEYILGVYKDKLYYVNSNYRDFTIEEADLSTGIAKEILSGEYFKDMDYESYSTYLKEKGRERVLLKNGYLYYSDKDDSNKLYRLDLNSGKKEKISNTEDCYIFDVIDGYVYYTTYDTSSKKNSFRRIWNDKEEIIVE